MKLSLLQQNFNTRGRSTSFRTGAVAGPLDSSVDNSIKSPASLFWLVLHGICCLISLVLGFRFSRLIFFLLFSTNINIYTTNTTNPLLKTTDFGGLLNIETPTTTLSSTSLPLLNLDASSNRTSSRVVVGRHGIRIRPWPHPDHIEVMKAHRIIERVQKEQRVQYGIKNPRTLIVVTPTYVRTFQTLHLNGLMHSLMLVPYDLIWIVVEAGGISNETAALVSKSGVRTIHLGFDEKMPISWEDRHRMEARMRLRALRVVREQRLDGIVMFGDDSNMHSMDLFDEIQSVKWMGAISVGILAHSGNSEESSSSLVQKQENEENSPMPIQGPACNSSGQLAGWHTFNSLPYKEKSAIFIDDRATVLPREFEWAGFVLNSRLLWKEPEERPVWVQDLDSLAADEVLESPLSLLKDTSFIEPLGNCGRKVLLWWLRVEARADSKFPFGWTIDPPLEIIVPSKRTPWPDAPPELPSSEKVNVVQDLSMKLPTKTTRVTRTKHSSHKRKREPRVRDTHVSARRSEEN